MLFSCLLFAVVAVAAVVALRGKRSPNPIYDSSRLTAAAAAMLISINAD